MNEWMGERQVEYISDTMSNKLLFNNLRRMDGGRLQIDGFIFIEQ